MFILLMSGSFLKKHYGKVHFLCKSFCHLKKSNNAPKKEYKEKMLKNNTIGSAKESRCKYSITYPESIMASAKRFRFKDLVRLQLK